MLEQLLADVERQTALSDLRGETVADLAHELGTVKAVRDQIRDEVDAMRPVVDAADKFDATELDRDHAWREMDRLRAAVEAYRARKAGT